VASVPGRGTRAAGGDRRVARERRACRAHAQRGGVADSARGCCRPQQWPEPAHYLAKRGTPPKKVRDGALHADARDLRLQAEARWAAGDVGEVAVQSVWRMRKARKTEAGAIAVGIILFNTNIITIANKNK